MLAIVVRRLVQFDQILQGGHGGANIWRVVYVDEVEVAVMDEFLQRIVPPLGHIFLSINSAHLAVDGFALVTIAPQVRALFRHSLQVERPTWALMHSLQQLDLFLAASQVRDRSLNGLWRDLALTRVHFYFLPQVTL